MKISIRFSVSIFLIIISTTLSTLIASAADWPCWRGPGGFGVSADADVPSRWSLEENVLWKIPDPGFGHSSPIVWGEALFLATAVGEDRVLLRLEAGTGREAWRRVVVRAPLEEKHQKNSHASSTPAADGQLVYVPFLDGKNVVIAAYDFDGQEAWRTSPGEFYCKHGFCSSPVLFEDLLLLNCDHDGDAYLAGLSKKTGEVRWKTPRENKVRSYCPPGIFSVNGRPQMILSGSQTVASFNPRDGKRLWVCDGPTEQCVASLVEGKGLIFVTGGFPDREILAIDPTGAGDVTRTHVRWRSKRGVSYVPSPVYHEGYFYVVSDSGVLSAIEASTGEYKGQKRLEGDFSASLLCVAGRICCFNESGVAFVLVKGPELELAARIDMGDPIYATPAVANGRLFLRTWKYLYAIGKVEKN